MGGAAAGQHVPAQPGPPTVVLPLFAATSHPSFHPPPTTCCRASCLACRVPSPPAAARRTCPAVSLPGGRALGLGARHCACWAADAIVCPADITSTGAFRLLQRQHPCCCLQCIASSDPTDKLHPPLHPPLHLPLSPADVADFEKLTAAGAEVIVCVSVNDAFAVSGGREPVPVIVAEEALQMGSASLPREPASLQREPASMQAAGRRLRAVGGG